MPKDTSVRKRMVVEEVNAPVEEKGPLEEENELLGVVKEKVGELQDITEHISDDIEKSSEVQEEIVEAAEKVPAPVSVEESIMPPQPMKETSPNPLLIIIPGVLLLGALLGGIYFYETSLNKSSDVTNTPSPTVAPAVVATPSASPSAQVDLKKYSISVQNGSGTPGVAGTVKSLLTTAGFKVGTTGNAPNYNFTKTIIKAKTTVDADYLAQLSAVLARTYVMDTNQTLATSSADTVQVIVGSSKN